MADLVERLVPEELWELFRRVVPPTEVYARYERKAEHFLPFVGIAAALISYRRLTK